MMTHDPSCPGRLPGAARSRRALRRTALVVGCYVLLAYLLVPLVWEAYARRRPSFDDNPRLTTTGDRHPGDPLNVALVGEGQRLKTAMEAAGWYPAKALGLRSDLKIAEDTILSRPDDEAPVSSLYLFGRKEDLAFEQPAGDSPRQRHHVRFWKTADVDDDGRPVWIGAASFDERVGLSHTTGQITHHIAADVDAERDHLFATLRAAQLLADEDTVPGFHTQREGRNGGGDLWRTDGRLRVGVLREESTASASATH
ncbi:MAG: LssY C-terminal domain-containing protein [Pirellulales bacterium]|nr:LssY C-terminal domain-containing protein [Pirellulales bacterium]